MVNKKQSVSGWSIIGSALAGLLGIQSRKNHERDFASGKFWHFFLAGALVTVLFVLIVWLGVRVFLSSL